MEKRELVMHLIDPLAMELLKSYLKDKPLSDVAEFGSYFYNSKPSTLTMTPREAAEEPVIQADA